MALAVLRRSLGLGMFVVLDSRLGSSVTLKRLRSWVLKVGSRQGANTVGAASCSAVLAATEACA